MPFVIKQITVDILIKNNYPETISGKEYKYTIVFKIVMKFSDRSSKP